MEILAETANEVGFEILQSDDSPITNFDGSEMTTGAGFADPAQAERGQHCCLRSRHVERWIAAVDGLVFD